MFHIIEHNSIIWNFVPMKKKRKLAQTLERTNTIVEVLAAHPGGVSLARLCAQTQLAKSTLHRILATLIHFRFVRQDPVTKQYSLGFKFLELGNILLRRIDIRKEAYPFLTALSNAIGETVHLVIRDGASAVYIDKIDSGVQGSLKMASRVGMAIPLYCSAVGKVFLFRMNEHEVCSLLGDGVLERFTEKTITAMAPLLAHLAEVRKAGFAVDDEENEYGIRCVAAPIEDSTGQVVAAISVSGPAVQVTLERIETDLSAQVIATARTVSQSLGCMDCRA